VDLDHKATGDLARMAVWSQEWKLIGLLEAVRAEVRLEDALLTVGGAPGLRMKDLLQEREGHA
jgi:hypothetical protein